MTRRKEDGAKAARVPGFPDWQTTPSTYIAGQEELDELDLVASAMERKWGADRLRLLVPKDLREKFDRQRYKVHHVIEGQGELEDVRRECRRMITAWKALDAAAEAAGASQVDPEVWECVGKTGVVYALVRTPGDARRVVASGRFIHVYSLDEIANLLDGFPELAKIKLTFPGAAVQRTRTWVGDPLDGLPNAKTPLDDPIPF